MKRCFTDSLYATYRCKIIGHACAEDAPLGNSVPMCFEPESRRPRQTWAQGRTWGSVEYVYYEFDDSQPDVFGSQTAFSEDTQCIHCIQAIDAHKGCPIRMCAGIWTQIYIPYCDANVSCENRIACKEFQWRLMLCCAVPYIMEWIRGTLHFCGWAPPCRIAELPSGWAEMPGPLVPVAVTQWGRLWGPRVLQCKTCCGQHLVNIPLSKKDRLIM